MPLSLCGPLQSRNSDISEMSVSDQEAFALYAYIAGCVIGLTRAFCFGKDSSCLFRALVAGRP